MPATAPSVAAPNRATQGSSTTTRVAWIPKREMDLTEWSRAASRLGMMDRCSPWWVGDCIRYGNAKFGEKYSLAAKLTGYDVQTLMNRVYVASHFDISRRRENLSWSHHEAVASLDSEAQDHWLDQAIKHKMSVVDLRHELRARLRGHTQPSDSGEKSESADEKESEAGVVCPNCGHQIQSSLLLRQLKDLPTSGDCGDKNGSAKKPGGD